MYSACFLAFATGFLSLSLEILWVRLFSFANHAMPQSFAFVLAFYLMGIAIGASAGKKCCKNKHANLWLICGAVLMVSSLLDVLSPWIYAYFALGKFQLMAAAVLILLTAGLKALAFPIAHHLGTPAYAVKVGKNISRVYVSNIIGATLGPLFTGIFVLAYLTTQQGFLLCAVLTFLVALACVWRFIPVWILGFNCLFMVSLFAFFASLNAHLLIEKIAMPTWGKVINVVENQYGIITVYPGGIQGDVIAGGNAYDGRMNINPVINSNRINRVLILAALVDEPANVLIIGLSGGSWLKLVTAFPGVENIDVIEINPGYLDIIQHYPVQQSALLDPRVNLYIDDGRRWLKAHPDKQYDLIIMNTTYHWRAYVTNLLSKEFLQTLKRHMTAKAVLEYNTTGSPDVLKTAHAVFKHAYLYENFVIAGNFDWREKLVKREAQQKLAGLMLDGAPLYPKGSEQLIAGYLHLPVSSLESLEPIYNDFGRSVEVITDQNVITEFKYGKSL